MKEYVVYRHGWNAANQSPAAGLPKKMAVARLEAGSPEEACRQAAPRVTLHENQYLSAEPAEEVDARENNLNLRAEALSDTPLP
ncbi:MAG TPA: hypothetical protein VH682_10080 [Gemmataceae bacterium]|jgi:hypothetical protein